jgi:hypothetical protein
MATVCCISGPTPLYDEDDGNGDGDDYDYNDRYTVL